MIEQIVVNKYRKLENLTFNFSSGVNIISGTNGTCKTSLLHMISNSFKAVTRTDKALIDPSCLTKIKTTNNILNPKIENLTRGDKEYKDPAPGHKGAIYEAHYSDGSTLSFRKHNSGINSRYAVKPMYKVDAGESLPSLPVLYLGLFRLFSFGEFQDDDELKKLKNNLPENYQKQIFEIYEDFTGLKVSGATNQEMGSIKKRADFTTDVNGIDSNTISAGEDNLFIIVTALVSLKYYFESTNQENSNGSILLVDEVDASLHPAFQNKLLNYFIKFSKEYNIQIFFTTHSLSLLEEAFLKKLNVTYLIDNIEKSQLLPDPDIYSIKMHLNQLTKEDDYLAKKIPIFTEDEEARIFLKQLFEFYSENRQFVNFDKNQSFFHFVNANIGSDNLIGIFNDGELLRSTMRSICILDGDQTPNMNNGIISLPGEASPEQLAIDYLRKLFDDKSEILDSPSFIVAGFTKPFLRDQFFKEIREFEKKLECMESTKGKRRDFNKKIFKSYSALFRMVFHTWIRDPKNEASIIRFYNNLGSMFKRVSTFHGINPNEWKMVKS